MSDDEVVLREVVKEEYFREQFEDQVKEVTKPVESKVASPKPTLSTNSLKKILSLSKCCQSTSSANTESSEATSNQKIVPRERKVKRATAELDMSRCSTTMTETDSWKRKPQNKVNEKHNCQ